MVLKAVDQILAVIIQMDTMQAVLVHVVRKAVELIIMVVIVMVQNLMAPIALDNIQMGLNPMELLAVVIILQVLIHILKSHAAIIVAAPSQILTIQVATILAEQKAMD